MIIVTVTKERNPRTGRMEEIVSHGVDADTGKTVILSCESPQAIGVVLTPRLENTSFGIARHAVIQGVHHEQKTATFDPR